MARGDYGGEGGGKLEEWELEVGELILDNVIPISYGKFYDSPTLVQFQFAFNWLFLHSIVDEEQDKYSDAYDLYLLPFQSKAEYRPIRIIGLN